MGNSTKVYCKVRIIERWKELFWRIKREKEKTNKLLKKWNSSGFYELLKILNCLLLAQSINDVRIVLNINRYHLQHPIYFGQGWWVTFFLFNFHHHSRHSTRRKTFIDGDWNENRNNFPISNRTYQKNVCVCVFAAKEWNNSWEKAMKMSTTSLPYDCLIDCWKPHEKKNLFLDPWSTAFVATPHSFLHFFSHISPDTKICVLCQ